MEEDAYHIIARGAFGDVFVWGETGRELHIIAADSQMMPPRESPEDMDFSLRGFFGTMNRDVCDLTGSEGTLFSPALKTLGRLKPDEMYGFVPALALGGPATLDHLEKVKAVEHLVFLAQLAPLNVLEF